MIVSSNVVLSWNVLRACAEVCILEKSLSPFQTSPFRDQLNVTRVAQASTVNVITMVYSEKPKFEYFPIDERHPTLPDEPYGLSKV